MYFPLNYNYIFYIFYFIFLGTKRDLWSTVSPKMAQRVFSGMLNESLSIIVTRFIYVRISNDRISLSLAMRIGNIDTEKYKPKIGSTEFGTIRTILGGCL